jgi:hypothetical protein|nr:MAG TPA_asm: hypothetical protein [Caudoviricetes sp.]
MIFYNDEIHQVYFRGRHHVAAYLGDILVWREDIRSLQGVEYLMAELQGDGALSPAAAARMTLALPVLGVREAIAEAILSQLLEAALPYRWAPVCLAVAEAISITGGDYALRFPATVKLLASGAKHPEAAEAYTLALHALPHSSPTLPVTIAPPALLRQSAKAVRSRVRRLQTAFTQGFVPGGLPHISATSRGDIDTLAAQMIGAVTAEAGLSEAVEGEAATKAQASVQLLLKKSAQLGGTAMTAIKSEATCKAVGWIDPVQYGALLVVKQVYSAAVKQDGVLGNILEVT